MKAEILNVGDELLIGQVINTNASWLGEQLTLAGVEVLRTVVLGDEETVIQREVKDSLERADLVVVTGGLGPTTDDVTRNAIAALFGVELRFNQAVFEAIRDRFARRNRVMAESNLVQALVPEGFDVLPNPTGTAPGLFRMREVAGRRQIVVVLPGVPYEMRYLFEHELLPRLVETGMLGFIRYRSLLTSGIGESDLQELIGDLAEWLSPTLRLAYLPSTTGVRLRITAYGESLEDAEARIALLESHLRQRLDKYLFGYDNESLEGVVGRLLAARGWTIGVAESCTGGYVLNRLTNVDGASRYVRGGVVAYDNEIKVRLLDVDPQTLETEGAVSEAVALQMARGARLRLDTDIGVSVTGIAGPSGGSPDKPVGTVWIGYSDRDTEYAFVRIFADDRLLNKELSSTAVLNVVRDRLAGEFTGDALS